MNTEYWLGAGLMSLLLLLGHWFPWPVKLHRLAAYSVGCTAIIAGFAVWLLLSDQAGLLTGIIGLFCISGIVTGTAYAIDSLLRGRILRQVWRDRQ